MNKQKGKYSHLVLKVAAESAAKLTKHTKGPGKRYVFSDHNNNPNGEVYSIVREVKDVSGPRQHVEPHFHSVDSLCMFLGDAEKMKGLQVEVQVDDEKYVVDSPASIYIPKGVNHTYRFIKGSGKYINIVLVKGGEYNTVTK